METGEWQAAFHAAEADQYGVKEVQGVYVLARELAEEDTVCPRFVVDTEGEVCGYIHLHPHNEFGSRDLLPPPNRWDTLLH